MIISFFVSSFFGLHVNAEQVTLPTQQEIQESYTKSELEFLYNHYGWSLDKEYMLLNFIEKWQSSMGQSYQLVSFEYPKNFMGLSVTDYVLPNSRLMGGGVNLYYRDEVYHYNSPNQHFQIFSIYLSDDPHLYFFGVGTEDLSGPNVMYANTELNERGHVIFEPTHNVDLTNAFRYIYYGDIQSYNTLLESY
ncbi:DUF4767 domain-containing protein [Fundicoccus sp. Sow4_H7]|uniref:DUF4767 domain-containing protein n=1 Tax=Fundicoccus sp. Sow4_H7 TaxID=3438784 RepID=UPI003F92D0B3